MPNHCKTDGVLVLPRLQVQNANAISSPFTWGFPAITAFTGFAHALERKWQSQMGKPWKVTGVGVVCHQFDPQVHQPAGRYNQVFRLSRHPVTKDGATAPIVEEGRAHLEVSLVLALDAQGDALPDTENAKLLVAQIMELVQAMRLAGGSILPNRYLARHKAQLMAWDADQVQRDKQLRLIKRQLLPGFALVARDDLMQSHLATLRQSQANANALDALLDLSALHVKPVKADAHNADEGEPEAAPSTKPHKVEWEASRRVKGWLVPIPVGYAAISPLYAPGTVRNVRDNTVPVRMVESVLTMGEWVSPHRITQLAQLLWYPSPGNGQSALYRYHNDYSAPSAVTALSTNNILN